MRTDSFVAIADETTLAQLPKPFTPAPPPSADRGKTSRLLIILAIIALLIIIATPVAFWLSSRSDESEPVASEIETSVATIVPTKEFSGALRPLEPSPTTQAMGEVDQSISATSEFTATPTNLPPASTTPLPTPTLVVTPERRGCANDRVFSFIWSDAQINSGCGITTQELNVGDEVRILSDQPIAPGGDCGVGQFIKVQSLADSNLEGWVHEGAIDPLEPGEICSQ